MINAPPVGGDTFFVSEVPEAGGFFAEVVPDDDIFGGGILFGGCFSDIMGCDAPPCCCCAPVDFRVSTFRGGGLTTVRVDVACKGFFTDVSIGVEFFSSLVTVFTEGGTRFISSFLWNVNRG